MLDILLSLHGIFYGSSQASENVLDSSTFATNYYAC